MSQETTIEIPNIGGSSEVEVIEILVKPGDHIEKETALVTLESDKASMEIPSPKSGEVKSVNLKLGDKVSEGSVILTLLEAGDDSEQTDSKTSNQQERQDVKDNSAEKSAKIQSSFQETEGNTSQHRQSEKKDETTSKTTSDGSEKAVKAGADLKQLENTASDSSAKMDDSVYAGPGVRRLAAELGVKLSLVGGSGLKGRVTREDLQQYVKDKLSKQSESGLSLPEAKLIDFSQFGPIEKKSLNKIKRITGSTLHRAWLTIPHVTQFDEADITALEAFRKEVAPQAQKEGYRLTLLAFVCKVLVQALKAFPQFNTSLDSQAQELIYKNYFHIGIAVETENGLVVPVLRDVDKLSVSEIAIQMAKISSKAREKGLMPADMQGGCMTISSLGGIGGTAFTPIVNSPEVAILGLSRSIMKPVYQQESFQPRLMLPLSLSYDHRVIDGAEAARFTRFIAESLEDIRRILL